MIYKPPKIKNKLQWVPIVAKNKDWLVGYICGIQMMEDLVLESLKENGVEVDLRGIELCLDSSRFNDVMYNGKRESECTAEEIKEYYRKIIEEKFDILSSEHPDNDVDVFEDCFLEVECVCELGVYTFKSPKDVPDKPLKCQVCGRTIIDYTEHDDEEYDYDGKVNNKTNEMIEELTEKIKGERENHEDDE